MINKLEEKSILEELEEIYEIAGEINSQDHISWAVYYASIIRQKIENLQKLIRNND